MKRLARFCVVLIVALMSNGLLAADLELPTNPQSQNFSTRYNWSEVSRVILQGKTTKMEQAEAIYDWLCRNIAYDTNYQIYHADECYDKRRGVCNAYCELFWQIAKPASLECILVVGKAKDYKGNINPNGHAWIMCNVGNGWILIDPTWGAGIVNDGVFTHKIDDKSWFNVPPKWMILSHFPNDERYQLLSSPVSKSEFYSMLPIYPNVAKLGRWGRELLDKAWNRSLESVPKIREKYAKNITIDSAPFNGELQVGQFYNFRVGKLSDVQFALIDKSRFWMDNDWTVDAQGYYNIRFMPRRAGDLKLSVKGDDGMYWEVVAYQVAEPTEEQIISLENYYPLESPAMQRVENLKVDAIDIYGLNPQRLLVMAKSGELRSMPTLYTNKDYGVKIVSIPLKKRLRVGSTYTFTLKPTVKKQWAVINKGADSSSDWYRDWKTGPNGEISITVTPKKAGSLQISQSSMHEQLFYSVIMYDVVN